MANFTVGIKKEIISKKSDLIALKSSLAAVLRTGGFISFTEGKLGFFLVTETERVAEYYVKALEKLYGISCVARAEEDNFTGREKLTVGYSGELNYDILYDLGVLEQNDEGGLSVFVGISPRIVETDEGKIGYIRGAFLGGGSCTVPRAGAKTGYHLEFVFTHARTAKDFVALIENMQLSAKVVRRKDTYVVYVTSLAGISDFLSVIGAENSLGKLSVMAEEREMSNNDNRVNNCIVGNMDRSFTAAAKQCLMMEWIRSNHVYERLDDELKHTVDARLSMPQATLKELALALGVSKGGVNHRIRKLTEVYESERIKTQEEDGV